MSMLKIEKVAGTYELSTKTNSIVFGLEFYQDGKRLDVNSARAGIGGPDPVLPTTGEFLLHMVDLDHLKLGDGQPNLWRINCSMRIRSTMPASTTVASHAPVDIPKTVFRSIRSRGYFTKSAGDKEKAPIFWLSSGPERHQFGVKELIEKNRSSSFIIGYLYFSDSHRKATGPRT